MDAVFPEVCGLRGPLTCLSEAQFGILAGFFGAARSCCLAARDHTASREQFGKPLAGFQLTQRKLADMGVEVNRAALDALRICQLKDAGALHHHHVSFGQARQRPRRARRRAQYPHPAGRQRDLARGPGDAAYGEPGDGPHR